MPNDTIIILSRRHEPQWPWWLLPVGSMLVAAVIVLVFGG